MKKDNLIADPNKRQTIIKGRSVSFKYPKHFTGQQMGFTSAVGAALLFPAYNKVSKAKSIRIASSVELSDVAVFKRRGHIRISKVIKNLYHLPEKMPKPKVKKQK
jgi:hypothetical protein